MTHDIRSHLTSLLQAALASVAPGAEADIHLEGVTKRFADTTAVDGPAGTPQLETWLTEDVPRFAKARLRTIEDRSA